MKLRTYKLGRDESNVLPRMLYDSINFMMNLL